MSKRRQFTSEEKVIIIKKVLVEKKQLSDICDEKQIGPSQFYKWQSEFFQNNLDTFDRPRKNKTEKKEAGKLKQLQEKIANRDQVIAELMQEYLALKKNFGEI